MSITRTPMGRLDLTEALPYEVLVVRLRSGSVIRFKPEWMVNQYVLYIDKDTTDEKVLDRLDRHVYRVVHRSKDTWIERILQSFGLLVLPTLDEVADATQYLAPINQLVERYDYSPKVGQELYVLPHCGCTPMVRLRLGVVAWVSV